MTVYPPKFALEVCNKLPGTVYLVTLNEGDVKSQCKLRQFCWKILMATAIFFSILFFAQDSHSDEKSRYFMHANAFSDICPIK